MKNLFVMMSRGIRGIFFGLLTVLLWSGMVSANADLQVSAYTALPDPVINGGAAVFAVTVQNSGPNPSSGGTLTIDLPANVNFTSAPDGCSLTGSHPSSQTLVCTVGALAVAQNISLTFSGVGATTDISVAATTATIVGSGPDLNPSNNSETKSITAIYGADLAVAITGPTTAVAGTSIAYTVTAANHGPDATDAFAVTVNLPPSSDFSYSSYAGSGWSCSGSNPLICTYSTSLTNGGSTNPLTINGTVQAGSGTISAGAAIAGTSSQIGDYNPDNDTAPNHVVSITPGTDLRANLSMVGADLGESNRYLSGESITLRLSATNNGPSNATGVTVVHTIPDALEGFNPATPPAGCSASARTLTCVVGNLNAGATSAAFVIPLTAPVVSETLNGSSSATVGRATPAEGANTPAALNWSVVVPYANLEIDSKIKGPSPVYQGDFITSTIRVRNAATSPSAATGTVTVVDELLDYPSESFVSNTANGWICSADEGTITCTYAIAGELAPDTFLPDLVISTKVADDFAGGNLRNQARTGPDISAHQPPATAPSQSLVVPVYGTPLQSDLSVGFSINTSPVGVATNSFNYVIEVGNAAASPHTAATVAVRAALPMWYSRAGNTGLAYAGLGAGESCDLTEGSSRYIACTLKDLEPGASRTITAMIARPVQSGSFANIAATVSSPDTVETNLANNSATASVVIDPIADVGITVAAAQNPVRAGVANLFTVAFGNNGPNPAADVVVQVPYDSAQVTLVGTPVLTGSGGNCSVGATLDAPFVGQTRIRCSGFDLGDNASRQLSFELRPNYSHYNSSHSGFPDAMTLQVESSIATTTHESNAGNNEGNITVGVSVPNLDLAVTKQEVMGYDPRGESANLLHDPIAFGHDIIYRVTVRNNGPSLATEVELLDTPASPAGYTMIYQSAAIDSGNSSFNPGLTCQEAGGTVTCRLGASLAQSNLPAGAQIAIDLTFTPNGPDPTTSLTFTNQAEVRSAETQASYDSLPGNNMVSESTTVLPVTDLGMTKQAVARDTTTEVAEVHLNQPFDYLLTIGNAGPSAAIGIKVTDTLPAGIVLDGTPANMVSVTGAVTGEASCSGTTTIICELSGNFPPGAGNAVRIRIPVKAAYRSDGNYPFTFDSNIVNTARVETLPNTTWDITAGNDVDSAVVQVRQSTLSGRVHRDNNLNDQFDSGEGINNVTLTLSGTDAYDNPITKTTTSNSSGVFQLAGLPPGDYQLERNAVSNHWDWLETAGSAGGTVPGACNGSDNCSNSPTLPEHRRITDIELPENTAATGYIFQLLGSSQVRGYIYHDRDNNGLRAASGEEGIANVAIHLSGSAYTGQDLCAVGGVICSAAGVVVANTNASGYYNFANLPPSDADNGYVVTQVTQPNGWLDGLNQHHADGAIVGSAAAERTTPEQIGLGHVAPGATLANNNFGELKPVTFGGYVFVDSNGNGVRDAGDVSGVPGMTMRLSGTTDLGDSVDETVTTGAAGSYSFAAGLNLRPGIYTITQESLPGGMSFTGAQVGMIGGSATGSADNDNHGVTGIDVGGISEAAGSNYNFGWSGQGLSGHVYVDVDRSGGITSADRGIGGVEISLSGVTAGGVDVCLAISPEPCTVTSGSDGGYSFPDLPASNASGYTLTQQNPASAPLNNYSSGPISVGQVNGSPSGSAGANAITGIVIGSTQSGSGYDFGHNATNLSGGSYHDRNKNGAQDAEEAGLSGVTMVLAGTTMTGEIVCDIIGTAACTVVTDAGGNFTFSGLPASGSSGYTLTQTQPLDYAVGTPAIPGANGTAGNTGGNIRIGDIAVAAGDDEMTDYLFANLTGELSGYVYHDLNADGVRDDGESGLAGVGVTLSGTTAAGVDICTLISCAIITAADGSYEFTDLRRADGGHYSITRSLPSEGYVAGRNGPGWIGASECGSCGTSEAAITAIPFVPESGFSEFNFALVKVAGISGYVYLDDNDNRVPDSGEELEGVSIHLTGTDDLGVAVDETVQTDAAGFYRFENVRPSDADGYTLTRTLPPGMGDYLEDGSQRGEVGGVPTGAAVHPDRITGIVLPSASAGENYNFRINSSSLEGYVYFDFNNDGVKDPAEPGLAGVEIRLFKGAEQVASTTTDSTGHFRFRGLPAADYSLQQVHPPAYLDGRETAGSAGGQVDNSSFSDAPEHNRIGNITLPAVTAASGYLFGEAVRAPEAVNDGSSGNAIGAAVTLSVVDNDPAGDFPLDPATVVLTGTGAVAGSELSADGKRLTVPGEGEWTVDAVSGAITFTPEDGFSGDPTPVAYRVADDQGNLSNEATVTITYTVAPVAENDANLGNPIGAAVTLDVVANDSASDGRTLNPQSVILSSDLAVDGGKRLVVPGEGVWTVDAVSGAITFTPEAGFSGNPTPVAYRVADDQGNLSNEATVTVTYTEAPVANDDESLDNPLGRPVTVAVLANDSAADGRTLDPQSVVLTSPAATAGGKELIVPGEGVWMVTGAGEIIFTPESGFFADPTPVTYRLADDQGNLSNEATLVVTFIDPSALSGRAYLRQNGEGIAGLVVELVDSSGAVVATTVTDGNGDYRIINLSPSVAGDQDSYYSVRFRDPASGAIYGIPRSDDPVGERNGVVDNGVITLLQLVPGVTTINQNLPLDPSGVIYNSVTREPVAGAQITLTHGGMAVAGECLVGGVNPLLTEGDGFYQFLLINPAPAGCPGNGEYALALTAPPGYAPPPSALLAPEAGAYTPTSGGLDLIQAQNGPPTGSQETTYYLSFNLTLGLSSEVVNNHIPLDPILGGALTLVKSSALVNVSVGQLVPYTITAINTLAVPLHNIDLRDIIPPGFAYRSGSATLDGVRAEPASTGRVLNWNDLSFAANERRTLKLLLVVGAGVEAGEYVNSVQGFNNLAPAPGNAVSNLATATVRVIPDPVFDCSEIIGKVFDDRNADGYQNQGEAGIPNVRLVTARGLLVTTDDEGRFHIACADVPNAVRGSNFIMKLDERTLPSGYRVTTENPRTVLLTRGKATKLNFGASIHRVVRIEITGSAFAANETVPGAELSDRLATLPELLREAPSVIRLAYNRSDESEELIRSRFRQIRERIENVWDAQGCCYALTFEEEIFSRNLQPEGGVQ